MKKETRGERVCRFIESYCVVPEGKLVGKPVKLAAFQKKFIIAIYDNPYVTDTAILSIARKNAKTGLITFIMLAHLVGPEAVLNSRIVSGALSKEQAAEVFNMASKCVRQSEKLSSMIRIIDSSKRMIGLGMNTEYQAISAEAKTAHGKSPILAILDEVGQIKGPTSDFVDAVTTAQGAYDNPLLIYISTQAANDADFFSIAIDDYENYKPPNMVCHVYAADDDCDVMDESQWAKANPALGNFRSLSDMKKQALKASRMPSFENTFRNLNLNQRVSRISPFIGKTVWKENGADQVPIHLCARIIGGLDLSKRTDLTAFVLYGLYEGEWSVYSYFWTPEKGLDEREKRDRAPYSLWVKQGYLLTTPGATVKYEYVAKQIADIIVDLEVEAIAFDRWRMDVFKTAVENEGYDFPLVDYGQGFKDMSPGLDALEENLLNKKIRHGNNPVLTMCAANAIIVKDPSENRKIDKSKSSARIDGMVALAMAAGTAERKDENENGNLDEFISNPVIL